MSDISLPPMPDRSLIILKKMQNKLMEYKPYKEGNDAKPNSLTIYNEILKREKIIESNMKASIANLTEYGLKQEVDESNIVLNEIQSLTNISNDFLKKEGAVLAKQDEIKKLYEMDEYVMDNLLSLQDNVNTFRSASISGEFEKNIIEKIKKNISEIKSSWEERRNFFSSKA